MAAAVSLLLFLFLPSLLSAETPDDIKNLLIIKRSLSDPPSLSSWNESTSPCKPATPWHGVACTSGSITKLVLESMSLSGSIDADALSRLTFLRTVSIYDNHLSGPIPAFNMLEGIKALYLASNNFSGTIPDNFFAGLDHLKKLNASNNHFSGPIPSSLSKASTLIELFLSHNRFSGEIPPLNLPTLQSFDVSDNELSGPISETLASKFNESVFATNRGLCGPPLVYKPCSSSKPSPSPSPSAAVANYKSNY